MTWFYLGGGKCGRRLSSYVWKLATLIGSPPRLDCFWIFIPPPGLDLNGPKTVKRTWQVHQVTPADCQHTKGLEA